MLLLKTSTFSLTSSGKKSFTGLKTVFSTSKQDLNGVKLRKHLLNIQIFWTKHSGPKNSKVLFDKLETVSF